MNYLIVGKENSGKSEYAEELVLRITKNHNKLYIATMIPYGEEGKERIRKHQSMREGKGFVTIEEARKLEKLCTVINGYDKTICLIECVSNLVANEMYSGEYEDLALSDEAITEEIVSQIKAVMNVSDETVIVTNHYEIKDDYDEDTKRYCSLIDKTNDILRNIVDEIHVVRDGKWSVYENS